MKKTYKNIIMEKANKSLNNHDLYQYEHLIVNNYVESTYKDTKEGYIAYINNLFFNKVEITLNEYQRLYDLISYK